MPSAFSAESAVVFSTRSYRVFCVLVGPRSLVRGLLASSGEGAMRRDGERPGRWHSGDGWPSLKEIADEAAAGAERQVLPKAFRCPCVEVVASTRGRRRAVAVLCSNAGESVPPGRWFSPRTASSPSTPGSDEEARFNLNTSPPEPSIACSRCSGSTSPTATLHLRMKQYGIDAVAVQRRPGVVTCPGEAWLSAPADPVHLSAFPGVTVPARGGALAMPLAFSPEPAGVLSPGSDRAFDVLAGTWSLVCELQACRLQR
jgi:hypothetical protein